MPVNQHGQPVGLALPAWQPPPRPAREPMAGRFCRQELSGVDADETFSPRAVVPACGGRFGSHAFVLTAWRDS